MRFCALLLMTACLSWGQVSPPIGRMLAPVMKFRVISGGACSTLQTNVTGGTSPNTAIQGPGAGLIIAVASPFTVRANCTICSATVTNLTQANNPAWSVYVAIYSDSGVDPAGAPAGNGSPGTQIGTASGQIVASTLSTTTPTFATFTGMSAALTAGTKYWYVILSTGPTRSPGDAVSWVINNNYGVPQSVVTSTDGTTWTFFNDFDLGVMTLYSQ